MAAIPMAEVDPQALMERVWEGRRNVMAARMTRLADLEDLQIVVSEEAYAMLDQYRRDKMPYYPISWEYPDVISRDVAVVPQMRMFGLPVVVDRDLMPNQVRFRMEVAA